MGGPEAEDLLDALDTQVSASFYHADYQGGPQLLTNQRGQLVSHTGFFPYGQRRDQLGELSVSGFAGSIRDDSPLGLVRFGARWYAPTLGRWASADPLFVMSPEKALESVLEANLYMYAGGNPVNKVDPSGFDPMTLGTIVAISAGIGAVTGAASSIASQYMMNDDQEIDWKKVGVATVTGAASGAALPLAVVGFGAVGGSAAVGGASGAIQVYGENAVSENPKDLDDPTLMKDAVVNAGLSATIGAIFKMKPYGSGGKPSPVTGKPVLDAVEKSVIKGSLSPKSAAAINVSNNLEVNFSKSTIPVVSTVNVGASFVGSELSSTLDSALDISSDSSGTTNSCSPQP